MGQSYTWVTGHTAVDGGGFLTCTKTSTQLFSLLALVRTTAPVGRVECSWAQQHASATEPLWQVFHECQLIFHTEVVPTYLQQ